MPHREPLRWHRVGPAHGLADIGNYSGRRIFHCRQNDGSLPLRQARENWVLVVKGSRANARGPPALYVALGRRLGIGPAITDHISSNDRDTP